MPAGASASPPTSGFIENPLFDLCISRLFSPFVIRHSSGLLPRSGLPFLPEKAKYHRELEAAVDAVERACRLCVDVGSRASGGDEIGERVAFLWCRNFPGF